MVFGDDGEAWGRDESTIGDDADTVYESEVALIGLSLCKSVWCLA